MTLDLEETKDILKRFILDKVEESGASGVVLGLSGGLDSAVVLKLCVNSLGKEKVHALLMPETLDDSHFLDAERYARELGVEYGIIEIGDAAEKFSEKFENLSKGAMDNIKARVRMILLYTYAYENNMIVMGTSNKSELLTGYFTKFGDGGVDFMPIGDLYKTEVMELARYIGVPEKFILKPPSAGLHPGQKDEDELGIKYEKLDCVLKGIEKDMSDDKISENCSIEKEEVIRVGKMVKRSIHKRKMPVIPKIGLRTVGWDWRE